MATTTQTPEQAIRELFADLAGVGTTKGRADFDAREIIITPYNGAYGFAGVVVVLEGTPPRGTFYVQAGAIDTNSTPIVYQDRCFTKVLTATRQPRMHAAVTRYLRSLGWTYHGRCPGVRYEDRNCRRDIVAV